MVETPAVSPGRKRPSLEMGRLVNWLPCAMRMQHQVSRILRARIEGGSGALPSHASRSQPSEVGLRLDAKHAHRHVQGTTEEDAINEASMTNDEPRPPGLDRRALIEGLMGDGLLKLASFVKSLGRVLRASPFCDLFEGSRNGCWQPRGSAWLVELRSEGEREGDSQPVGSLFAIAPWSPKPLTY